MKTIKDFFRKIGDFGRNLSLRAKIILVINTVMLVLIVFVTNYVSNALRRLTIDRATKEIAAVTEQYASIIERDIEAKLLITKTLSTVIQNLPPADSQQQNNPLQAAYKQVLEANPDVQMVWNTQNLQQNKQKLYNYAGYKNSKIVSVTDTLSTAITQTKSCVTLDGAEHEYLTEPYFDQSQQNNEQQKLITSVIVSNNTGNGHCGLIGMDMDLAELSAIINQIAPFKNSYAFMLSSKFKYIAYPEADLVGTDAYERYGEIFRNNDILDRLTNGNPAFCQCTDYQGTTSLFSVRPINVGKCQHPWSLVIVVPKQSVMYESIKIMVISFAVGILGIMLLGIYVDSTSKRYVLRPVLKISTALDDIGKGLIMDHVSEKDLNRKDEIGLMFANLHKTEIGLSQKMAFSQEISTGNYEASLQLLSQDDALGQSLIEMAQGLQRARDEEQKRQADDRNRQWINEGLAQFGAILRQDNDNLERLSTNIVQNLVKNLEANQGGMFILNTDNEAQKSFDLVAAYAYNRQKFIKKSILAGEGLVGTCALEKQTIHMTNIPANYITISSGLGEAKPRALLIVPLKLEDEVLGVVEIASFNDFAPHQIDFVEKVAQSIAQTITTVRTALQTQELLERTQQQAEEMKAQEEEVRQNFEELETIKEELEKRNDEILGNQNDLKKENVLLDSLLRCLPDQISFKDEEGRFIRVSQAALQAMNLEKPEQIIGYTDFDFLETDRAQRVYDEEQRIIKNNSPMLGIIHDQRAADGTTAWFETSKLPLTLENGEVFGTLSVTRDITDKRLCEQRIMEQKEEAEKYMKLIEYADHERQSLFNAVSNASYVMEYSPDGVITYVNGAYLSLFGLSEDEVLGKHHSYKMELTAEQRDNYQQFWVDLNLGMIRQETSKFVVNEHTYTFHETYSPITDANGKVYKIIKIAVNISHLT